jgi:hypothetical protein
VSLFTRHLTYSRCRHAVRACCCQHGNEYSVFIKAAASWGTVSFLRTLIHAVILPFYLIWTFSVGVTCVFALICFIMTYCSLSDRGLWAVRSSCCVRVTHYSQASGRVEFLTRVCVDTWAIWRCSLTVWAMWNGREIVNGKSGRMWKESVMEHLRQSQCFVLETEKNCSKP